jgi:hypothetical protein
MYLRARQSLLGSVYTGDVWMQFLRYASVRVKAGSDLPPHFSKWTNSLGSMLDMTVTESPSPPEVLANDGFTSQGGSLTGKIR